ncbi:MAG: alpha/beta fold hydrolase [Acidimicrobiia bacterium]
MATGPMATGPVPADPTANRPTAGTGLERTAVGAVPLAYAEEGRGGRPLLAVHGFTGAKEDFAAQARRLARSGWHTVMPDLRGHGASPTPATGYDLTTMAADLAGLVDSLGWTRFALLGHSMGGMVAQRLAVDLAARAGRASSPVAALVLVGTTDGPVPIERSLVELACTVVADGGMPALLAAQKALGTALVTSSASADRLRVLHPDWDGYRDRSLLACAPAMYVEAARGLLDTPSRLDELAGLRVPVLVVVGDEDTVMLPGSRRLAAGIPGARLVVVEGAGHHPQAEHPEAFAATVADFLDAALPGAGRASGPAP